MCKYVINVVVKTLGLHVLFGGDTNQAFAIDVDTERVVAGDDYVDAHVKLVTEQKEWVVYVPADDTWLVLRSLLGLVKDEDAFSLARARGLHDPEVAPGRSLQGSLLTTLGVSLLPLVLEVLLKLVELIRQHERFGNEVEVGFGVLHLHFLDVDGKSVFACEL